MALETGTIRRTRVRLYRFTSSLRRGFFLFGLVAASSPAYSSEVISYHLSYNLDEPGFVAVRIDLPENQSGVRIFVMPRAIPMGYAEVQYERFIDQVNAFSSSGDPVSVKRTTGPRWQVGNAETTVRRIEYKVNVERMERELLSAADSSKMRRNYLGLLGYSVFGYVDGLEDREIKLAVSVPAAWPVFSTLAPQAPASMETTRASAADFYELADSQIIAGPAAIIQRLNGQVPLFLALYSEADADVPLIGRLIEETMAQVVEYFDSVPFEHYTVYYELLKPVSDRHKYGFSMEHMDSCTIFLDASRTLRSGSSDSDKFRTRYNLAHHIAHSWIPKRSCGEGYFPFTWEHAPIIDTIWLSEGFVQYAAVEMITDGLPVSKRQEIRDPLIDRRFRKSLVDAPEFINRLSLTELSRAASTKYSEDFRYGRNVFSRGAMMALELDERIRRMSDEKKRFRDVMRFLMVWSERERRPFKAREIPSLIADATGIDVRSVMDRWMKPPIE